MVDGPPDGKANAPVAVAVAKDAVTTSSSDVVLIGPPTADGGGVHVLRARNERIEAGELRGVQEGKPLTGEIVTLKPRDGNARICDVTDSYVSPAQVTAPALGHKGPARVATAAYRDGWDSIFGAKSTPPAAVN
jgi:hypothetical protein